ncbi:MgtC/SapB family protein [Candidatus Woesearchaeota archaeon]|nr:MgtC/SapB family protein [Candidatus Woesearchaeota archaeon]
MITDIEIFLRLILAAFAGSLIGFERKTVHKPAGIRTHMLVALGSALFAIVSIESFANTDPSRIAAGIVTGIGFLGAGTIFRSKNTVKGLTTAASLWAVAGIGLTAALGEYLLMAVSTILIILILKLKKIKSLREN